MSYQMSSYKRDRSDDGDSYGHPAKRMGTAAGYGGGAPSGARSAATSYNSYPSPPKSLSRQQPGHIEDKPNNVLLFTVFNPKYPITVDVMHTICTSNGAAVNRIVIFRKNGVQAMVEFDSVESAELVKESLNGADIYSGCCTLKVDWGKPTRLNVMKNDQDSWDYTANLEEKELMKPQALLPDPKFAPGGGGGGQYAGHHEGPPRRGYPPAPEYGYDRYGAAPQTDPYDTYGRMPAPVDPRYPGPVARGPRPQGDMYAPEGYGLQPKRPRLPYRGPLPPGAHLQPPVAPGYDDGSGSMLQQGSVLMVYGLHSEKMNCQKLFNLFCLYGNIVRVKFLKSKEGVAMIQLGDSASCQRAIQNINGCFMFGHKMLMGYSKQAFIQDVQNPVDLPDGTVSFMDFMGNRNNRFTTPEAAAKNRIQPASKVIYFFNSPPGLKEENVKQIFTDADVSPPTKIRIFPSKTERSSTGLLEWENKGDCIEAVVTCNNTAIPNPSGKNPYIMKFCFSDSPIKGH